MKFTLGKYMKHHSSLEHSVDAAKLFGSSAKIQRTLGWKPTGAFPDLVREIVEAELAPIDEGRKNAV
jgi:GDP-D-mannose dehydratase